MTTDVKWRRLDGSRIDKPIVEAVKEAILRERALGYKLKACIGTDSQVYGQRIEYATVIVILREGRGGFMFISNYRERKVIGIKERMLNEVAMSIGVAYELCELFESQDVDLEVHADINTNPGFQSNKALNEAMGYILSMGFVFKAKPDAFASSSCANKVI